MDDLTVPTVSRKYAISVCFISLDAYPLFSRRETGVQGGAEVDIYMLSTELAKDKKFKVSLITGDYGQNPVEQIEGVTIYRTADLQSPMAAALSIWKAMGKVNADIYFKKGASLVTALVGVFCKVNRRVLVLRTAQDIECDGTYICENWLRGRAFLWTLKQAKQVVTKDTRRRIKRQVPGIAGNVI